MHFEVFRQILKTRLIFQSLNTILNEMKNESIKQQDSLQKCGCNTI